MVIVVVYFPSPFIMFDSSVIRQSRQHNPHQSEQPVCIHARILEAATAICFGFVIDTTTKYIRRSFYRGAGHNYRAPIADVRNV